MMNPPLLLMSLTTNLYLPGLMLRTVLPFDVSDSWPLLPIVALMVPIVGSLFMPTGSTDLSPLPDVFVYGFDGGVGGAPSLSTGSTVRVTAGWFRSWNVYEAPALNVCAGSSRNASQPESSVLKRSTPGPVSWNCTQPLQPVKSFGAMSSTPTPPGRTSLNMMGVLTSIW